MTQTYLKASQHDALSGTVRVPGDKSISHRAIMLGALAKGKTAISGLLEGEDVLATAKAMEALGAKAARQDDGTWHVESPGARNLHTPEHDLDMGNSGTSTRLLMGLIGGLPITATLFGDASLTKRPMGRVSAPLSQMGVQFSPDGQDTLPLTIHGQQDLKSIEYRLPVASAQVKSAILLAGLHADGVTKVIEDKPTRDHSENMLRHFGVKIETDDLGQGSSMISIEGGQTLQGGTHIHVPGDPSSAAFPAVAAVIKEGSEITLQNVGTNDRRTGIYRCLEEMGAAITYQNRRIEGGEPVADITIKAAPLSGIIVPQSRVPSMIDEFPIFAMAAACASGKTVMTGLEELRVKESDRLLMIAKGLKSAGISVEMQEDGLIIEGMGNERPKGGCRIETALDHRIAMAFLVLGGVTKEPVEIDDAAPIATSFPNFVTLMNDIGARIAA